MQNLLEGLQSLQEEVAESEDGPAGVYMTYEEAPTKGPDEIMARLGLKTTGKVGAPELIRMYYALREHLINNHTEEFLKVSTTMDKGYPSPVEVTEEETDQVKGTRGNIWVDELSDTFLPNEEAHMLRDQALDMFSKIQTPDALDEGVITKIHNMCGEVPAEASEIEIITLKNSIYPLVDILKPKTM
jgi:hypothetical protein